MAMGELVMPKLGLTMTEGTLGPWLIERGGWFAAGATLVTVETDKIAYEVEAPASGTLQEVLAPEGSVVAVGAPIARWDLEGGRAAAPPPAAEPAAQQPPIGQPAVAPPISSLAGTSNGSASQRIVATPYARRLAQEQGIDLSRVQPAGDGRRIRAADVQRALDERAVREVEAHKAEDSKIATAEPRSTGAVPLVFVGAEVEVSAAEALCAAVAPSLEARAAPLHFVILALAKALAADPASPVCLIAVSEKGSLDAARFHPSALRLSVLIAALDHPIEAQPADKPLFLVLPARGSTNLLAQTPPKGCIASLGIGAVQHRFEPDAQGSPVLRQHIQLTLAARTEAFDPAAAQDLLERIKTLLETPLRLLVA